MDEARVVAGPPNDLVLASQAIAGSVLPDFLWGGNPRLPAGSLEVRDVRFDPERLGRYREVCGFPDDQGVPATYPHVLGFKLSMAIMTSRAFPLPVLGMIHMGNRISVIRPLAVSTPVTVRVRAADLRPHPKGAAVDVITALYAGDRIVWQETSTYLSRGSKVAGPATDGFAHRQWPEPPADAISVDLDVPAGTGRRYASVSGDNNPIHTYDLTARLFGFPRAIAQGMWTLARCLAEVADLLPDTYEVEAVFRRPVIMPAQTRITRAGDDGWVVWLTDRTGDVTHLVMHVR